METVVFAIAAVLLCGFLFVQSLMAFAILNAAVQEIRRRLVRAAHATAPAGLAAR